MDLTSIQWLQHELLRIMMFNLHVDYPPCFVPSKFDFTSLISVRGKSKCPATPTAQRVHCMQQFKYCIHACDNVIFCDVPIY